MRTREELELDMLYNAWVARCILIQKAIIQRNPDNAAFFTRRALESWKKYDQARLKADRQIALQRWERKAA